MVASINRGDTMIHNFRDRETEKIASGQRSRKLPVDIQPKAFIILQMLEAATRLDDMKSPPGNRFHALDRDRKGQYSVSINMQWRICFRWSDGGATDVEITDYH
jgi:toxin HigB-1